MSVGIIQLIVMIFYLALLFLAIFLAKNKFFKTACLPLIVVFILVFANPVRFKQDGISRLESNVSRFKVSERVIVYRDSFEEKQAAEMLKIKQQSKGMENEIHN